MGQREQSRQSLPPPQLTVTPKRRAAATGAHGVLEWSTWITSASANVRCRRHSRVLKAYPESKIDLKPSEKSRTAADLVMILAVEERVLQALMQTGSTDPTLLNFEVRSSMAKIISIWQQAVR